MKRLLIAAGFLFILFVPSIYAMDSNDNEVMEELSVYITNKADNPVYVQYYIGPSWNLSDSKGSQLVPAGAVNLLAKEGVTCYAEIGNAGVSKNQRNFITVNVYDNASPDRKLLGTQSAKLYIYLDKDITRDKGNYWMVYILEDYKVTVRHVQLYTGRDDTSTNIGRTAMHYRLIRARTTQGALVIGLISLILFIKSMKNGMMVGSKISKLGLLFLVINSLIVVTFCVIDTVDAIETSSSGFALIPVMMIDFPAVFIAFPISGLLNKLIPVPLTNDIYIINQYTIVTKSILAVSILIFGGLQWYFIGWFISKLKKRFFTRPKVKEQFK